MNPWAPILIGIGIILIIIGLKGTQHNVVAAFRGVKTTSASGSTSGGNTGVTAV